MHAQGSRNQPVPILVAAITLWTAVPAFPALAAWPTEGVLVSGASGQQFAAGLHPDGQGGFFVPWYSETPDGYEAWLKRFDASGNLAPGWPASGRLVVPSPLGMLQFAPDGNGGLFVLWGAPNYSDQAFRVTHVDGMGLTSPGWPAGGRPLSGLEGFQRNAWLIADGAGGAFACWLDLQDGDIHVHVQRFLDNGTSPVGWPEHGLTIKPGFSSQDEPFLALGSDGGLWVGWNDDGFSAGTTSVESPSYRRNVQHVLPQGIEDPGFPGSGLVVGGWDLYAYMTLVADGAGGVYATWTGSNGQGQSGCFAQHYSVTGGIVSGWPTSGRLYGVSSFILPTGGGATSDGLGGLLTSWLSYDIPTDKMQTRVKRLLSNSQTAAGWDTNGVHVGDVRVYAGFPAVVPDLAGGAIVAWTDSAASDADLDVVARVILPGGQMHPTTPEPYVALGGAGNQSLAGILGDGAGGVFVAWNDDQSGASDVYLGHLARSQIVTGVSEPRPRAAGLSLGNPVPNPSFGPSTVLLSLPRDAAVEAEVLDLAGRRQRSVLQHSVLTAGDHPLVWDGRDDQGRSASPGVYLFRVRVAGESKAVRLLHLR